MIAIPDPGKEVIAAQVEAIRERHQRAEFDDSPGEFYCAACQQTSGLWPCDATLLCDAYDALTVRAEAAERKVAAVRDLLRTSVQTMPSGSAVYEMVDADEIARALDGETR